MKKEKQFIVAMYDSNSATAFIVDDPNDENNGKEIKDFYRKYAGRELRRVYWEEMKRLLDNYNNSQKKTVVNKNATQEEINIMIGKNVRKIRKRAGMSQEATGDILGVSFQQIQKYENGQNRVSGVRLAQMCKIFKCEVIAFFDGVL